MKTIFIVYLLSCSMIISIVSVTLGFPVDTVSRIILYGSFPLMVVLSIIYLVIEHSLGSLMQNVNDCGVELQSGNNVQLIKSASI